MFSSFHFDLTHWLGVIFRSVLALGVLGTRTLAGEVLGNTCAIVTCMWQVLFLIFDVCVSSSCGAGHSNFVLQISHYVLCFIEFQMICSIFMFFVDFLKNILYSFLDAAMCSDSNSSCIYVYVRKRSAS